MALDVDKVFKEFLNQINKNQSSGYVNGDEYNIMIDRVNLDWYNDNYKIYESSSKNTDDMQMLKTSTGVSIVNGSGALPSDYYHFDKATHTYYISQTVSKQRPLEYKSSSQEDFGFFEPTLKYPTFEIFGNSIKVKPTTITYITLDYLRVPTTPVWGYTVDGNGMEVYDSTTSTNFEIPEYAFTDIVNRLVALLATSTGDQALLAYAIQNENKS